MRSPSKKDSPLRKVLVVNDEPHGWVYLRELERSVPRKSFDVAHDAEQAIGLLQKNQYDAVILDVFIPRSGEDWRVRGADKRANSVQVAEEFRRTNPVAPLLLVSSYAEQSKKYYPKGTVAISNARNFSSGDNWMRSVARTLKRDFRDNSAPAVRTELSVPLTPETRQTPVSRILAVRHGPFHNGSADAASQAWSETVESPGSIDPYNPFAKSR